MTVKTPTGTELAELCDMLGRVFAVEEKLFGEVKTGRVTLPEWTPYAGYLDGNLVANVALIDMAVYRQGRPLQVAGVASVATVPEVRRRGFARQLMDHAMQVADRRGIPSVLFTDLPQVYEGHGFHVVEQPYRQVRLQDNPFRPTGQAAQLVGTVDQRLFAAMQEVHQRELPHYDDKPVRPVDTQSFQRFLFNESANTKALLIKESDRPVAWLRFETSPDRLTLTDLACPPERIDCTETLMHRLVELARLDEKDLMTVALPAGHPLWPLTAAVGWTFEPERDARRETFMVRPRKGGLKDELDTLMWSLADRF